MLMYSITMCLMLAGQKYLVLVEFWSACQRPDPAPSEIANQKARGGPQTATCYVTVLIFAFPKTATQYFTVGKRGGPQAPKTTTNYVTVVFVLIHAFT